MASIGQSWMSFKTWMSARSQRELMLLAASVIAVSFFAMDRLFFSGQSQRLAQVDQQLLIAKGMLSGAQTVLRNLESGDAGSVKADKTQTELDELRRQVRIIDAVLGNAQQVASPRFGALVKSLIATQHPRVTLVALKTIPSKPIIPLGQAGAGPGSSAGELYRHGVEVEISGAYMDLLAYLRALESGSKGLFWSDARLSAANYPDVTLKLTVYILSNRPDPLIS